MKIRLLFVSVFVAADMSAVVPAKAPAGVAASDWSSIRSAHQAWRHAFQPTDTGWRALNPGQQWTTRFDARGFVTEPRGGGWQWGLALRSYGFGASQRAIEGEPAMRAEGQRLTYQWDALVQEWWVNDRRGLEHGFVVAQRPGADASASASVAAAVPLSFLLEVRGTLVPAISADALGVIFKDAAGATVLNYAGLKVWDADGRILASRFEPAGADAVRLLIDERGARYPLTVDPVAQQAYLKPAAVGARQIADAFGEFVAVSGDTVVVGATSEESSTLGVNSTPNDNVNGAGAAYVFVRSGAGWTQQAYLKPAAVGLTQSGDAFGAAVAISGDILVVGAPSEDSGSTGVNSAPDETLSGAGAAYVFVRSGGIWTQSASLKPAISIRPHGIRFGASVAVSGETVVVGAPLEDTNNVGVNSVPNPVLKNDPIYPDQYDSGGAYVFVRTAGVWAQQAYLKPVSVGASQEDDLFGLSVGISGDTIVVGAPGEDSSTLGVNFPPNENAPFAGAAYVFARSGAAWTQQAYLKPAAVGTTQRDDNFGQSVAVSGDTIVVGAPREDGSATGVNGTPNEGASDSGAAYVFTRSGAAWTQQAYLKPARVGVTQAGDKFGTSVAVAGDLVVVGAPSEGSSTTGIDSAPNEPVNFALDPGAAYVFARDGSTWTQRAYLKPAAVGTTQAGDQMGNSVAVSGDVVVVGASREDSGTLGVNSTPNEGAINSGAAYIYTVVPDGPPPPPAAPSRLANLSVLTSLDSPTDEFTLGYVVVGAGTTGAKPLVIRAVGPALGALGVPGTISDPRLELFAGAAKTGENDNWGGGADLVTAMLNVGAFPYAAPTSRDAAVAASISTRDNSVRVTGVGGATGAVIAEVYDASPAATFAATTPRLLNVSVRKHLGASLTAGFVVGGTTSVRVLIRVVGPGLAPFGVPGTVVDPQLTLFRGQAEIDTNDNWAAADIAAFDSVGAFRLPANSRDAALVTSLAPGNYSVRATGVGGTTGTALVEVYELP